MSDSQQADALEHGSADAIHEVDSARLTMREGRAHELNVGGANMYV
ncbi:MAG: hypothetical protein WAU33_13000 [Candidatus Binataceae bacterium]